MYGLIRITRYSYAMKPGLDIRSRFLLLRVITSIQPTLQDFITDLGDDGVHVYLIRRNSIKSFRDT
jgi:hypothetical protein